ncbi:hypothetical protein NIES4102_03570 [Chondrocystis sp. NIES-4102]|nr:hypothetical protein NIES4102_03570 [Chondrocystis sp. NIES-4102]
MANKDPKLPKHLVQGKTAKSIEAVVPVATGGGGGHIETNWKDINWTRKKLTLAIAFLSIPYIIAIISTLKSGHLLITAILIGLGVFVGLLYLALKIIQNNTF